MTIPGLFYDDETHTYFYEDKWVPSPSRVIKDLNLWALDARAWEHIEAAANRGKLVHEAVQHYHDGTLDYDRIPLEAQPYFKAYLSFIKDASPQLISSEEMLYSHFHKYAMRLDLVMKIDGAIALIDIKTSNKIHWTSSIQLTAYERCWGEWYKKTPIKISYILHLKRNGKYAMEYVDTNDFWEDWKGALKLWYRKVKAGDLQCPMIKI